MSIHIVDIHQTRNGTESVDEIIQMLSDIVNHGSPQHLTAAVNCALVGMQTLIVQKVLTLGEFMDKLLIGRINAVGDSIVVDGLQLGRHGIRAITSTWAKHNAPKARKELVITLLDQDDGSVHTFIIYV